MGDFTIFSRILSWFWIIFFTLIFKCWKKVDICILFKISRSFQCRNLFSHIFHRLASKSPYVNLIFWTFLDHLKNCDLCRPFSLRVFKLQGMTIPPVDSKFYADQGNGVIFSIGITLVVISPVPVNSTFCNFPIIQFWPLFNQIFDPEDVDFTKNHFWQEIFKIFSSFRIRNPFIRSYHGFWAINRDANTNFFIFDPIFSPFRA